MQKRRLTGWWGYGVGTGSMFVSTFCITVLALTAIVGVEPWYQPQYAIPMLGMMLGNTMNGNPSHHLNHPSRPATLPIKTACNHIPGTDKILSETSANAGRANSHKPTPSTLLPSAQDGDMQELMRILRMATNLIMIRSNRDQVQKESR